MNTERGLTRRAYLPVAGLHAVAIALILSLAAAAQGQLAPGTQIQTLIRPIIYTQYGAGPFGADQTAVGIFDTGDPAETFARETSVTLGVNVVTPMHTNAAMARAYNQGSTAPTSVTSGGWLGGSFDLERNTPNPLPAGADPGVRSNDPAHIFTNATGINRTAGLAAANQRLWYLDYNRNVDAGRNGFTENHTSTSFVSSANAANNLVAFVDPINGTPLPFAYDNSNGNGRNLFVPPAAPDNNPANISLDQRASSVSYFAGNSPRVPTPANNTNPGFVTFVDLEPREFTSTLTPLNGGPGVVIDNAAPAGTREMTLSVSNADAANVGGIRPGSQAGLQAGSYTIDPEYAPVNVAGNALLAYTMSYRVSPDVAQGGAVNANGFVRTDGSVRVRVVNQSNGAVVIPFQDIPLPSQAPRPFGSIVIPALGINTGGAPRLIDTGGTVTNAGGLIGTDITNRFGQVWDFRNVNANNHGRLTLIGPTDAFVRQATGNGILMNVDRNTVGLARTGVEQEKLYGSVPQLQIGAATAAGVGGGDGIPNQAHGTTFRTHLTGSNASYIDENATGISRGVAGRRIDAMSLGADPIEPVADLFFSVAPGAVGLAGSDVAVQSARNQSASDIYRATANAVPGPGSNTLFVNQEVMGLGPNTGPLVNAPASTDNLTDFDLFTGRAMPAVSMSNLDSPIEVANDSGTPNRARVSAERYRGNFDQYFSVEDTTGNGDGDRIYRSSFFDLFADGTTMGLADIRGNGSFDDIDALALYRPSVKPGTIGGPRQAGPNTSPDLQQNFNFGGGFFVFDPNGNRDFKGIDMFNGGPATDLALFSLAPGSEALNFFGLSPADLFITDFDGSFSLFATAGNLGLTSADNIDGLDTLPEPSALALLAIASCAALGRRRRVR